MDLNRYRPASDLLAGRVILVTGASRGLGRAVALACAKVGATVVLHGRDIDLLNGVYDEIVGAGLPEPAALPLDLQTAGEREYSQMRGVIESQLGRLDGIVHCASHLEKLSPLATQTIEEWQHMLRVNLIAPFAINRACAPLLQRSPDASVVMTSESHAGSAPAFWGGYAVSKAGLETLARIQSEEWSQARNLRINVVVPGPIRSPLRSKTHPGQARDEVPAPDTVVPYFLFLLGPDGRGISGQIFRAQG